MIDSIIYSTERHRSSVESKLAATKAKMKAATGQSDSSAPSLSRNISDLVTTGRDYEVDTVLSDNLDGIKSLQEEIAAADILSQRLSSPISVGSASRNGTKATRLSSEDMKSLALIVTPDTNKRPEAFCHSAPMTPDLFSSIKPPSETIVTLPFLFVNESTESANQLQGLVTLSNMTIITSNALKEQKNFLPDSIVPTVDLNHGEETSEEQQERLRTENIHLLYDGTKQRANFIAPPKEVIELLREVWNLNREESKPDRVGRKLVPVQSFYPNLLNHLLRTPGFRKWVIGNACDCLYLVDSPFAFLVDEQPLWQALLIVIYSSPVAKRK